MAGERRRRKRVQTTTERINEVGEGRSNRAGHAADEVEAKNQWNLKMKMKMSRSKPVDLPYIVFIIIIIITVRSSAPWRECNAKKGLRMMMMMSRQPVC